MTDTISPTEVTTVVDTYLASLHETDAAKRATLVTEAWAPDGHFFDPLQEAQGHAALAEIAPLVHEQFPGARFRRRSGIDLHHNFVRFAWDLAAEDGSVIIDGIDVGLLDEAGRLLYIVGFFGNPPEE